MYIHLGNNVIISDKKLIGIFNKDTLMYSNDNTWLILNAGVDDKTIAIDEKNNIFSSNVSSFTVIKRTILDEDFVWRKK